MLFRSTATSKDESLVREEMGFTFPLMLQLERSRWCRLDIVVTCKTRPGKIFSLGQVGPIETHLGEFLLQHISLLLCKVHNLGSGSYFVNPNGQNLKTWVVSLQS